MLDILTILQLYLLLLISGCSVLILAKLMSRYTLVPINQNAQIPQGNDLVKDIKGMLKGYDMVQAKRIKKATKGKKSGETTNNSNDLLGNILGSPMVQDLMQSAVKGFLTPPKENNKK